MLEEFKNQEPGAARILVRFMGNLILRGIFSPILPKKFLVRIQHTLLDMHFTMLLERTYSSQIS